MKKLISIFTVLLLIAVLVPKVSNAQAESSWIDDLYWEWFVPCADNGNGEMAVGTLKLHTVLNSKKDGSFSAHYQPAGGECIGQTTGTVYKMNGCTQDRQNVTVTNEGFVYTATNSYQMIGIGHGVSFRAHESIRITVNALGETKVDFEKHNITCDQEESSCCNN